MVVISSNPWTCPFCPLACDHVGVDTAASELRLRGGDCARAARALATFGREPATPQAWVDGAPASPEDAAAAAAQRLAASRQPLFAGLGCDVAGARALYPLACETGAICDAVGGDALMQGLRALQDRGQFTTTFAEVRTRADVVVFVGDVPLDDAPLVGERLGIGADPAGARHVVVLGAGARSAAAIAAWRARGLEVETPDGADLFTALGLLSSAVGERPAGAPLQALAARLLAARYAVFVGAPGGLPAHAALLIEAVHRIVGVLNRTTRAAALWIGGGDGAATANQVFAWLSGLPLRTRAGARGLEHEPLLHGATRLLANGGADLLLWVSAFDANAHPPATDLPLIALAHPAQAEALARRGAVAIAVSTPGIGSSGHLFRSDGTVLMPLSAARPDSLPTVAGAVALIRSAGGAR